jgi:hypothetical protein
MTSPSEGTITQPPRPREQTQTGMRGEADPLVPETAGPLSQPNPLTSLGASVRSVARWIALLGVVLAASVDLYVVHADGVNVVFWDQWVLIPLFVKYFNGRVTLQDLFAQHNEHRMFFPRIVMLAIGGLTHYNNIAEMYCSWVFLCVVALAYALSTRRVLRPYGGTLLSLLPVIVLAYSLRQQEVLLFGIELQWTLGMAGLLLAAFFLDGVEACRPYLLWAAVAAIVSTFSFADGLLAWPIGVVQLLWLHGFSPRERDRRNSWTVWTWVGMGIAVYALYFIGYTKPAQNPSLTYIFRHPIVAAQYFVVVVGGALGPDLGTASIFGVLLTGSYLVVLVLLARSRGEVRSSVPLSMSLFSLGAAALLTIGRAGFGPQEALTSRYALLTIPGVVGLYLYVRISDRVTSSVGPYVLGFFFATLAIGLPASYIAGWGTAQATRADRVTLAYYLSTFEYQSDQTLSNLFPDPSLVRQEAPILMDRHLNVFSTPAVTVKGLAPLPAKTYYSIDAINGTSSSKLRPPSIVSMGRDQSFRVEGWAVDVAAKGPAGGVTVLVGGADVPCEYGISRYAVTREYGDSTYQHSGFMCEFAGSILRAGTYYVSLRILSQDRSAYYQENGVLRLEVR